VLVLEDRPAGVIHKIAIADAFCSHSYPSLTPAWNLVIRGVLPSSPKRAETINVAVAQSVQNANDGEIARSPVNNTPKNNPIQKTHANMGNARVGTLPQKW
jgi:hypothetical protein